MISPRPRHAHACDQGIFLGREKPCGCVVVAGSIRSPCSPAHQSLFEATGGDYPVGIYGRDLFYCDRHFNTPRVVSADNEWCSISTRGYMDSPSLTTALHLALARALLDLSTEPCGGCCFPGEHRGQLVEPFWNMMSCERHAPLVLTALEGLVEVGGGEPSYVRCPDDPEWIQVSRPAVLNEGDIIVAGSEPTNEASIVDTSASDPSPAEPAPAPPRTDPLLSREEFAAMKERFQRYLTSHEREWWSGMDEIVRRKDLPLLFDLVEDLVER